MQNKNNNYIVKNVPYLYCVWQDLSRPIQGLTQTYTGIGPMTQTYTKNVPCLYFVWQDLSIRPGKNYCPKIKMNSKSVIPIIYPFAPPLYGGGHRTDG